jgi:hypothetical protein
VTVSRPVREAVANLARRARQEQDVDDILETITHTAVDVIDGVDYCSVSFRRGQDPVETLAPTHPIAVAADELQYELEEGPCYDAVQTEPFVLSKHLDEDQRWPRYTKMVADLGIASQMSTVLLITSDSRAALNLYSSQADGFDDLNDAEQFAFLAGLMLEDCEHLQHLDTAQGSRTVIGQATGIVMERFSMDRDAAFGHLVRVSQTTNVKLRRVAQRIVDDTERR